MRDPAEKFVWKKRGNYLLQRLADQEAGYSFERQRHIGSATEANGEIGMTTYQRQRQ